MKVMPPQFTVEPFAETETEPPTAWHAGVAA
jgi:hypothetical protein